MRRNQFNFKTLRFADLSANAQAVIVNLFRCNIGSEQMVQAWLAITTAGERLISGFYCGEAEQGCIAVIAACAVKDCKPEAFLIAGKRTAELTDVDLIAETLGITRNQLNDIAQCWDGCTDREREEAVAWLRHLLMLSRPVKPDDKMAEITELLEKKRRPVTAKKKREAASKEVILV